MLFDKDATREALLNGFYFCAALTDLQVLQFQRQMNINYISWVKSTRMGITDSAAELK